jgi:hypothetical protein
MLALAVVDDILDDDQLFMLLIEGDAEDIPHIRLIASENLFVHTRYPSRRIEKTLTVNILTDQPQNFADMMLDLFSVFTHTVVFIFLGRHDLSSFSYAVYGSDLQPAQSR